MQEESWQKVLKFSAIFFSVIAGIFILKTLRGIFVPLMIAIFLSYLFAPAVEFLAKIKIPRILSLFILLAIIFLIGAFVAQVLVKNAKEFIAFWPTMESQIITNIGHFLTNYVKIDTSTLASILKSTRVEEFLQSAFSFSLSFAGKFMLTLLILVFIYLTYHNYPRLIKKAFRHNKVSEIFKILRNINTQIINYIFIKTLISMGTGFLTGIACWLLGIKFAVLWGFLAFMLNYIPYIGSLAAVLFPITLSLLQFPHSYIPLFTAISLIVIQMFMGSYLDPEMMGNRFNLSPILIIVSLFFWSYVWGIVGAFIAVPIMAVVKIVLMNIETMKPIAILMSKKAENI
jgi:AI-2 transport protein TqsA